MEILRLFCCFLIMCWILNDQNSFQSCWARFKNWWYRNWKIVMVGNKHDDDTTGPVHRRDTAGPVESSSWVFSFVQSLKSRWWTRTAFELQRGSYCGPQGVILQKTWWYACMRPAKVCGLKVVSIDWMSRVVTARIKNRWGCWGTQITKLWGTAVALLF